MDPTVVLGWIMMAWAIGTLMGAAAGHFNARQQQEHQNTQTNDTLNNL